MPPTTSTPILSMRGVSKSFGPVQVLRGIDFDAYAGQVTALVGDNGAGKSTLVKCIAGTYSIDAGQTVFDGQPVTIHSPRDAAAPGHRDRVPGPRPGRQPRHRPEHVPGPRAQVRPGAGRGLDGGARRQDPDLAVGAHGEVHAPEGLQPVRRPAADRGDRQGRAVEQQGGHPRRADRGPGRGADRAGAGARPPPGRQRRVRHPHLAQHERRLRGLGQHRGALPRPDGRPGARQRGHLLAGGRADHLRPQRRPGPGRRPGPTATATAAGACPAPPRPSRRTRAPRTPRRTPRPPRRGSTPHEQHHNSGRLRGPAAARDAPPWAPTWATTGAGSAAARSAPCRPSWRSSSCRSSSRARARSS